MKYAKVTIWALLCLFVFVVACDGGGRSATPEGDDDNSGDDDDDNNDDGFDSDQWEDDDDDNDDETDTYMDGCEGVDFLFVIDNSRSMDDEQQNLINSFPGFIAEITEAIDIDNYHIMAVDSDGFNFQGCDGRLGAGHVGNNVQTNCDIAGGNRYLIKDQPELNDAFACIARVGVTGSGNEKVMEAMTRSVTAENAPNQCNAGFIRDNAILVVTFITDETWCDPPDGDCSAGDPTSWKADLVAAKNGFERSIVVLGVFGDNDLDDGICTEYDTAGNGAMGAPVLREFLESFDEDRRQFCSVCEESYQQCFHEAVKIIDDTCDDGVE